MKKPHLIEDNQLQELGTSVKGAGNGEVLEQVPYQKGASILH